MRTIDVIKLGIDRNFLRQCERQSLISPKKTRSEWIVHDEYMPREYTQEDIEIVWDAYLYRKMGLSYSQINQLLQGEEISVRDSLADLINKYEEQIEELKALTEFMRYVKGIGFLPSPPETLIGSKNFKEYLLDFMKYLDEDKKIKKVIDVAEIFNSTSDLENINDERLEEIELARKEIAPNVTDDISDGLALAILELQDNLGLEPNSKDVQDIIHRIYHYQKLLVKNQDLSAWDFASSYIFMLSCDSDISRMYIKIINEEAFEFFKSALIHFLIIEEPEKIKSWPIHNKFVEIEALIVISP